MCLETNRRGEKLHSALFSFQFFFLKRKQLHYPRCRCAFFFFLWKGPSACACLLSWSIEDDVGCPREKKEKLSQIVGHASVNAPVRGVTVWTLARPRPGYSHETEVMSNSLQTSSRNKLRPSGESLYIVQPSVIRSIRIDQLRSWYALSFGNALISSLI